MHTRYVWEMPSKILLTTIRCLILLGSVSSSTGRYLFVVGTLLVRAVTPQALRARVVIVHILVPVWAHIIREACFYLFLSFFVVWSTRAPLNTLAHRTDRATNSAVCFWLSYAHRLGRAGLGTESEAGRLYFVYARWYFANKIATNSLKSAWTTTVAPIIHNILVEVLM